MPAYLQLRLRAPDRLPEIDADGVLQIAALLRSRIRSLLAAPEKIRKQIPERSAARVSLPAARFRLLPDVIRKVEPSKIHVRPLSGLRPWLRPGVGVNAKLVIHLPLLIVTQNVERFLYCLEAIFRRFVTRI